MNTKPKTELNISVFMQKRISVNGDFLKKAICIVTCLAKAWMSSLKESEEQTSSCASPRCRGEHVASSHFSNTRANRGNRGCLRDKGNKKIMLENRSFKT